MRRGAEPDRPFTGRLMVRRQPKLHRKLYVEAREGGQSLDRLITKRLRGSI
jgi:predicted HicB family RNase H-like nuclease